MGNSTAKDMRIVIQTIVIFSLILALVLIGVNYLFDKFLKPDTSVQKSIAASLNLFIAWMVVSSGVRNLNRVSQTLGGLLYLLGGVIMAIGGLYVQEFAVKLINENVSSLKLSAMGTDQLLYFGAIGFVAGLLNLIRMKVKNRTLATLLEVAIIIGIIAYLWYYMK